MRLQPRPSVIRRALAIEVRRRRRFAPDVDEISGRGAPTRNTIAAAYGSWREALEAVGLDTTTSYSTERVAALRAGSAHHHAAQRARSQEAVLAAVRRCITEFGHEPGATEFLRWRAANAPESPSQMTIYRSFHGGFAEALAAARAEGPLEDAA